jgi:hypothetical protein
VFCLLANRIKALFGDLLLYFCALFFSKCAVLLLCRRLTPKREHYIAITTVFVLACLWVVSSILLIAIKCDATQSLLNVAEQCPALVGLNSLEKQIITKRIGFTLEGNMCYRHHDRNINVLLCRSPCGRTTYVMET